MISDEKRMFFDGKLMNSDEKTTNFGGKTVKFRSKSGKKCWKNSKNRWKIAENRHKKRLKNRTNKLIANNLSSIYAKKRQKTSLYIYKKKERKKDIVVVRETTTDDNVPLETIVRINGGSYWTNKAAAFARQTRGVFLANAGQQPHKPQRFCLQSPGILDKKTARWPLTEALCLAKSPKTSSLKRIKNLFMPHKTVIFAR